MNPFLQRHGWSVQGSVGQDVSTRHYARVEKNGRTAIFMQNDGADAAHDIADFIRIGAWLRGIGLSAPEIYDADEKQGVLLLEDFGSTSFKAAMDRGHDRQELYGLALDVLDYLAAQDCPPGLPDYHAGNIHRGRRRIIDWYLPVSREQKNPDGLVEKYLEVWDEIESGLAPCPQGFVHADFHVENLMLLPGEKGLKRCGILDFQDAMKGPVPYDPGNLLEDARINVPDRIRAPFLKNQNENFQDWYRVLATQFHCRVIGLFVRLAFRDGKTAYLVHIPRLAAYIDAALQNPLLKPLKDFFSDLKVDFKDPIDMNSGRMRGYIREDAF